MNDTNPLAPIEALVNREERRVRQALMPLTSPAWVTVRELRAALAEARQIIERAALVQPATDEEAGQ